MTKDVDRLNTIDAAREESHHVLTAIQRYDADRGDDAALDGLTGMLRAAYARGLEEALECCAEMLPEHEVERLRDTFKETKR